MKQHLKRAEWRRLEDYISVNRATIEVARPSRDRLAETATKMLGFPVSESHATKAAETMGIHLMRAKPVFRAKPEEQEIAVVTRFIIRLAEDLGVKVPDDVRDIAGDENNEPTRAGFDAGE